MGPAKRLVLLSNPLRANHKKMLKEVPAISSVN